MPNLVIAQRHQFTLHLITTTAKANYTICQVGTETVGTVAASPAPWIHLQSKIDLRLDMTLNVVKWKYVWQYEAPTINDEGVEIPYVLRTWPKGKRIPPMPVGPAAMLWLEQVSSSLETSDNAGRKSLYELGLRGGEHLVIAPCLVMGK